MIYTFSFFASFTSDEENNRPKASFNFDQFFFQLEPACHSKRALGWGKYLASVVYVCSANISFFSSIQALFQEIWKSDYCLRN